MIPHRWLRALVVLLLAVQVTACKKRRPQSAGEIAKQEERIAQQVRQFETATGVDVFVYREGGPEPETMKGARIEPVRPQDLEEHLPTVKKVLDAYPLEFRRRLVPQLRIVGNLNVNGTPFLGMAFPKTGRFDLAVRTRSTAPKIFATMHHELAHMVQGLPEFDRARWASFSQGSYVGMKPSTKWKKGQKKWFDAGFVSIYGSKNPAEDFSEMAELAFTRPDKARELFQAYPLIRQKMTFMTRCYQEASPEMELPWIGTGWEKWQREHAGEKRRKKRRKDVADAPFAWIPLESEPAS